MRRTEYCFHTYKDSPIDAEIPSHQLMLRSSMIIREASGIYTWLPLGLRVLKKIEGIVRDLHIDHGCHEVLMPILQPGSLWQESGRLDSYGREMLRVKDRHDRCLLFGPTNEEVITDIIRRCALSHKVLPQCLFQIQWKFRDEIRPRFGVMRGREFCMKDAYSFAESEQQSHDIYKRMFVLYRHIFHALGLSIVATKADTGPIGGSISHEFHVLASTGESDIYYDDKLLSLPREASYDEVISYYAASDTMYKGEPNVHTSRGIEVGHIFSFGTKYSQPMQAFFTSEQGENLPLYMGSYGIGISRLVAALIEANHDEYGIMWPVQVAPFKVGIINAMSSDSSLCERADSLYSALYKAGHEPFYDDRSSVRPGVKFADMDLMGMPLQVTLGKGTQQEGTVDIKWRVSGKKESVPLDTALEYVTHALHTLHS